MTMAMYNLKRTADEAFSADVDQLEFMPQIKRPRFTTLDVDQLMMLGLVPSMTIPTYSKKPPNASIVRSVRQILLTGAKSQKQIARECGLSPTKMSQFMNLSPRTKGWGVVEAKILAWIENFKATESNQILPMPVKPSYHIVPEPVIKFNGMEVRVRNIYNPNQGGVTSTLSVTPDPEAASHLDTTDTTSSMNSYYSSQSSYESPSSSMASSESCPEFLSFDVESSCRNSDLSSYEWNNVDNLISWS